MSAAADVRPMMARRRGTGGLSFRRKAVNFIMLNLTGVCTLIAVGLLFFILGYLFFQGGFSLNLDFFTKLPVPVGEMGGGMANALVGSAKVLLLATCIGVPIGFLAGIYLAEYANPGFAATIQFVTDLLNGVPSIVIGIFAYALIVIKIGFSDGRVFAFGAGFITRGCDGARCNEIADDCNSGGAGRNPRFDFRYDAELGARGGRDRSVAVYSPRKSVLEQGLEAADRYAPGNDLRIR